MAGRKLEFDKPSALDAAMRVFWKKGYVGTSLADLTGAMGINKPSLYSAFGNKEALFVRALHQYLEKHAKDRLAYLNDDNLKLTQRISGFLLASVRGQLADETPKGCYLAQGLSETAGEGLPEAAIQALKAADEENMRLLVRFFQSDAESQRFGLDRQAEKVALYLVTLLHGTASLSRSGRSKTELEGVLEFALRGLGINEDEEG
ncbi:TetR/AcrR family transcriptional regulator [Microbulbifer sp. PSTR4-B]|uniref:TetR/AcrR family transcriptional regulator n=1 Tax=Microbulbifer sp. PSTR4-B TaxID=3243396 RepID=UPI0040395A7D